jgi:hypothetical protein
MASADGELAAVAHREDALHRAAAEGELASVDF